MKHIIEKVITRTAEFWLDDNGILCIKLLPVAIIDTEDVTDNMLVTRHLTGNRPALKLLDPRTKWKMTPEAEVIYKREDSPERTIAWAVLTDSVIDKLVQSFLVKLFKPSVPLKFFTNEADAVKWLLTFNR